MMDLPLDSIICHDVTQPFPLPDQCIDVVITSPPYWGLRDYGIKSIFGGDPNCHHDFSEYDAKLLHENRQNLDGGTIGNDKFRKKLHGFGNAKAGFCSKCDAWYGQLGLEPHPQMFIDHLVQICQEIKRVLKKSGSFYLNLGDTYGTHQSGGKNSSHNFRSPETAEKVGHSLKKPRKGFSEKFIMEKQLLLIPSRVAIALQNDGWILRNKNVWHKPNPMPSSAKDRLSNTWEPVFHFVKNRRYYYDLDAIREPHKTESLKRAEYGFNVIPRAWEQEVIPVSGGKKVNIDCHPAGKNPGDVVEYDLSKECGLPITGPKARSNLPSQYQHRDDNPIDNNSKGKNPGDVIQFDEEYWWSFIIGKAHSNRFYKKAYEIMKEWMVKNNCFDYAIFYEWYKKEFKGEWESGTLEKGKANYLSDGKRLPFPKPETRFLGDVPSDFWEICTQPFTGYNPDLEHFAVFPESLVLKPLKAAGPKEICRKCGKLRIRITKPDNPSKTDFDRDNLVKATEVQKTSNPQSIKSLHRNLSPDGKTKGVYYSGETVGWSDCGCGVGFDSGVVLDPFCGRGTVGKVAKKLGLHYILFDAKPEYCELAQLYIGGQKYKIHKDQSKLGIDET